MPRIKEYTTSVDPAGPAGVPRGSYASADAFGAGVADSLSGFGNSMMASAGIIGSHLDEMETEDIRTRLAKAQADWTEKYIQRSQSAQPGDMTFAGSLEQDMASDFTSMREGIQSQKALAAFDQQSTAVIGHFKAKALDFQTQLAGEKAQVDWLDTVGAYQRTVFNDPTQYGLALEQGLAALDDPQGRYARLPAKERMQFKHSFQDQISYATMLGLAQSTPEVLLSKIRPEELAKFRPTQRVTSAQQTGAADFQSALKFVMSQEGGYADNDGGTGAPVNYGINQKYNPDIDVSKLTPEKASEILKTRYWDQIGADNFSPQMAVAAFDTAVNMGVGAAKTLLDKSNGDVQTFLDLRRQKYKDIAQNPAKAQYLNGWLNRVDALQAQLDAMPTDSANPAVMDAAPSRIGIKAFDDLPFDKQYQIVNLAEQGVRANQVRGLLRDQLAKDALKAQRQGTQTDFLSRMQSGSQNPLTVDDILKSNLDPFGGGGKEWFLQAVRNNYYREAKTDPVTFNDLFQRINAQADSPNRIKDENELNAYLGNGLDFNALNQLRGELMGKHTADGAWEAELKAQVYRMARAELVKSDVDYGIADPKGEELYTNFLSSFSQEYLRLRKEGKTEFQLLDPKSPDYLPGRLLEPLKRTPVEILRDRAKELLKDVDGSKKTEAIPKKPGETPAAYLARVGGSK